MKLKDVISGLKSEIMGLKIYQKDLIARKDLAVQQFGILANENEILKIQLTELAAEKEELKRQSKMAVKYKMAQ